MLSGASRQRALFFACVLVGIALRAYVSRRGWNFDTEMLFKVASLPAGANFYSEIPFFANWGPIPYNLFQFIHALPGGDQLATFHTYLAVFFTICDVVSSVVLWRLWGLRAAAWFLVASPVAIVLSGFHCNAEPALVAIVLVGYYLHARRGQGDALIHPALLVCLGLSLAFKHAFILFPVWLALRPGRLRERARILVIPYGIWGAFALYYLLPTPLPFISNVLLYGGWSGNSLVPMTLEWIFRTLRVAGSDLPKAWLPLFLIAMLGIGWRVRRWPLERGLLLYPLAMLVTTSAIALQYFNLASFSIAARLDLAGVAFNAFAAYFYGAQELTLWTLPAWLQDSWIPRGTPTNVGWLILQAILAVVLARRLSEGGDVGTPRSRVSSVAETTAIAGN
jgi:hypothetical protein